jgi:hypothetical protein
VSACTWSLVGADAAAADHVLVLPGVLCSTAYVAEEGGRSSPGRVSACAWEPVWRQRIMCWSCRTSMLDGRMLLKKKAVAAAPAACVTGGEERTCVAWRLDRLSVWAWRCLCAVGRWRPEKMAFVRQSACDAQTQRRGVRTMCRSCVKAFVHPGTCVVQRRKLRRSAARRHRSSERGEHACSGSVARQHGESGRSGGCISKEDGATARTLQLGAHCRDVQLGSGGRELSTTA